VAAASLTLRSSVREQSFGALREWEPSATISRNPNNDFPKMRARSLVVVGGLRVGEVEHLSITRLLALTSMARAC
jgi:hypothetical protein